MPSRLHVWLAAALPCLALLGACVKKPPPEARRTLPNGLRLIVQPSPGAPNAALVVLFDVGGDDDPPGRSGLAHLVEHLYVTAAAGPFPARTAEQLMATHPAGWNAQTGDRYTVVASVFPAASLDAELDEAAARMGSLRITDADLAREKPRMMEELANMYRRVPLLAAMNHAREKARPSPRGGRRGGLEEAIQRITVEEAQARWRDLYKPANALVVLTADLAPAEALARLEERFSALPAGVRVEPAPAPGAGSPGVTPVGESGAAACSALSIPVPGEADYPAALAFASGLLLAPPGPVTARFAPLDDPALLIVCAAPGPGEAPADVPARLDAHVRSALASSPASARAVRRALGPMLGTDPWPAAALEANPYGVAFSLGRRAQLGLDGAKLASQLDSLPAAETHAFAKRFLADRATVTLVGR